MVVPTGTSQAETLAALGTDPARGLEPAEAARRLGRYGPNVLAPGRRWPAWTWVLHPFLDPMVLLLVGGALAYLLVGDRLEAGALLVATVPVVLLDLVLEGRSERALEHLRRLVAPRVEVVRGGHRLTLPSEDLVPGDLVLLRAGDFAPADGLLLNGGPLHLDESPITGESAPVVKEALPALAPPSDEASPAVDARVLAGTVVLSGQGSMAVVATGPRTEYGRIGTLVAGIRAEPTPLERSVRGLARRIAPLAGVAIVAVAAVELARAHGWQAAISAAVASAIALIPEEFAVVLALYLALGAWRMATRRALVRRLASVETLGSATVICTDKTGTLTLGRMAVTGLWDTHHTLAEEALAPGTLLDASACALLEAAVHACEVEPSDPLDQAIVAFARQHGVDAAQLHARWTLAQVYPFDPRLRYVTHTWHARDGGGARVCAKGSLEALLELCTPPPEQAAAALEANRALAGRGMRVLAVGERCPPSLAGDRASDEAGLTLRGLVAFTDPPRPEVPQAIARCLQAGVRVVMMTGDHPLTAHAVAEQIGLPHRDDRIVTGPELERMSVEAVARAARETNVFARLQPVQKHVLVRGFKAAGEVVAMTGDGINDAPALKEADIGVAMGQRGTEVARQAASMVLLDDNFATIVAAIEEGRRIVDNLRHAFRYLVGFHVPIVLGTLLVPLVGLPLLLLPIHLVWLELVLHPTIALVFQADPPAPDLMRRPPRPPGAPLLAPADLALPSIQGLSVSAGVLGLFVWGLASGPEEGARALALAALLLAQTLMLLAHRVPERPWWASNLGANPVLLPVLGATLASLALLLSLPGVAQVLRLAPLGPGQWLLAVATAAATTLWLEPLKVARAGRGGD
ncbi:MAG: cation-transporting P-type ATPase [Chloroflexi bacterium]|nr:cation-transporting P-type ATPase [Chloroflexota bacterium]